MSKTKEAKKSGTKTLEKRLADAPARKHDSPQLLLEQLETIDRRAERYFDKSTDAGVITQDALADIRFLVELAKKAEASAKAEKEQLIAHKSSGGLFEPGKIVVKITSYPATSVPWKDEWAKTESALATLKGVAVNLTEREEQVKTAYPTKTTNRVEIIIGD